MSRSTPLPAQDWELLASPGHVIGKRTTASVRRLLLPACAALIISIVAAFVAVTKPVPALPQWIEERIPTFDPATFVKIPGGGAAPWVFDYLAQLTAEPGLGRREFKALETAARADIGQYGDSTQLWQAVAGLEKQPLVTRPQKAFGANAARLAHGLIVLPLGYQPGGIVWAISWVEGRLTWAELGPAGCQLLLGSTEVGQTIGCGMAPVGVLLEKAYGMERSSMFRPAYTAPAR